MRWKNEKVSPVRGDDTRTIVTLSIFPKTIKEETRWLEWSSILQCRHLVHKALSPGVYIQKWKWVDEKWNNA